MDIRQLPTQPLPLNKLAPNTGQITDVPKNPRLIRDERFKQLCKSLQEDDLTGVEPCKVVPFGDKFVVLGGNMRYRALKEIGAKDVSCIVVPDDTPAKVLRKIVQIDNSQFGEYDWDLIANEWDEVELADWGLELPNRSKDNNYSRKVGAPIYEPTEEIAPSVEDCVNTDKYNELLAEIDKVEISEDDRWLLKMAACRHIAFDYKNIAERYAHADKAVQELMEKSALVIIDFGSAIENGFVELTEKLKKTISDDEE